MALPSLSFGISLRQHPAEPFEEQDLEFESVFLQRRVSDKPGSCWISVVISPSIQIRTLWARERDITVTSPMSDDVA
jgi:hypothetical protein